MIPESYLALARYLDEYRSVRESLTAQGTSSVRLYMIQRKGIAAKQVINEVINLFTERNSKFWNQFVQGVAQALVHQRIGNFPEIILEDFQVTSSPGDVILQLIATGTMAIEGKLVIEVGGYTPGPLPSPDLVFGWSVQARYEDRILSIRVRIEFLEVEDTPIPLLLGTLGWFFGAPAMQGLLGAAGGIAVGVVINSIYTGPGVHGEIVDTLNSAFDSVTGVVTVGDLTFFSARPEDAALELGLDVSFLSMADAGLR